MYVNEECFVFLYVFLRLLNKKCGIFHSFGNFMSHYIYLMKETLLIGKGNPIVILNKHYCYVCPIKNNLLVTLSTDALQ